MSDTQMQKSRQRFRDTGFQPKVSGNTFMNSTTVSGRGERIRTSDSCVPNAVLYQAELRPESYYYYYYY